MSEMNDWNTQVIAEFRANDGKVSGNFQGAPMILVHHVGRKSGSAYVTPMMYLADDNDPKVDYIFASKAGAPAHPDWYYNLVVAGKTEVEIGTETIPVSVTEVTGEKRDVIYAEQVSRFPGFGEYEVKTAGIRTIPVLALTRA
jgi:deazaflavin-dependent oxidoreductase (nitroreductase family)